MGQKSTNEIGPFARAVNAELRAAAARRGLNQTQLGERAGIAQSSISKLLYREVAALTGRPVPRLTGLLALTRRDAALGAVGGGRWALYLGLFTPTCR